MAKPNLWVHLSQRTNIFFRINCNTACKGVAFTIGIEIECDPDGDFDDHQPKGRGLE